MADIQIKNRYNGQVIFNFTEENGNTQDSVFKDAVQKAIDEGVSLRNADFHFEDLTDMRFSGVDFSGGSFSGANIDNTVFENCDLVGVNLRSATVDDATFKNSDLRNADLRYIVGEADFSNTVLQGAKFSVVDQGWLVDRGVNLRGAEFIEEPENPREIVRSEAEIISEQQANHEEELNADNVTAPIDVSSDMQTEVPPEIKPIKNSQIREKITDKILYTASQELQDIHGDALSMRETLAEAVAQKVNLSNANFDFEDLSRMKIEGINLEGASFEGADLSKTTFKNCSMKDAYFESADLRGTAFDGPNTFGPAPVRDMQSVIAPERETPSVVEPIQPPTTQPMGEANIEQNQDEKFIAKATEKAAELRDELFEQAKSSIENRNPEVSAEQKLNQNQSLFSRLSRSLAHKMPAVIDTAMLNTFNRFAKPDVVIGYNKEPAVQKSLEERFNRPLAVENHRLKVKDGDLYYMRGKETAFVDRGERVDVNTERHALAALKYSQQKWGAVEIKGSPEFVEACIKIAAAHDIQIMNPELQERIEKARELHQSQQNEIKPFTAPLDKKETNPAQYAQQSPYSIQERFDIRFNKGDLVPVMLSGAQHVQLMAELDNLHAKELSDTLNAQSMAYEHGFNVEQNVEHDLDSAMPFVDLEEQLAEYDRQNPSVYIDRDMEHNMGYNHDYEPSLELDR